MKVQLAFFCEEIDGLVDELNTREDALSMDGAAASMRPSLFATSASFTSVLGVFGGDTQPYRAFDAFLQRRELDGAAALEDVLASYGDVQARLQYCMLALQAA